MPKPYFLPRPSGMYLRFLVPVYAREAVGSRFLVKSLGDLRGDAARLAAARLGYALAQQFRELRGMGNREQGPRKAVVLTDTDGNELRDYTVEVGPDGTRRISADSAADHALAMEAWRAIEPRQLAEATALFEMDAPSTAHPSSGASARPQHGVLSPSGPALPQLEERAQLFLTQFSQKQRSAANVHDTTHTLRLFVGIVGDKALAAVGTEDMDKWLDALAHFPPNATKRDAFKDLTPTEVVTLAKRTKVPAISLRTREKHLDRLRVFFNWAVERRDIGRNPCSALHVMTREQEETQSRRSFTTGELAKIFDPQLRAKACRTPAQWWLPALALYTGARAQELAQLHAQDVEEVSGIWGIHIAARFPGQRLKNRQSKRFVPLHPALIEAGFLEYVAHRTSELGDGPLFSELGAKPGDALGDWFNRSLLRKQCGIEGQVFHCFRHGFATAADRAGDPDHRIARLTGHSQGSSVLRGSYIDTPTLPERAAAIAAVSFETVRLLPYSPQAFADFYLRVKRQHRRSAAVEARKERQAVSTKPSS